MRKVQGHERQKRFLRRALSSGRLAHGYLFSGEDQLGKRTLAHRFLKNVHCSKESACDECHICRMFEDGTHPDTLFLEPDENGSIKIKEAKKVVRHLSLRPSLSSFKTVLIDEAHRMTPDAQNSLLKTLEEPGGYSLIVLVTNQPDSLVDTILSRLQEVAFFPLRGKEMSVLVEGLDDDQKDRVINLSAGRPGRVVDFVESPEYIKTEMGREEELIGMARSCLGDRFKFAKDLSKQSPEDVLESWLMYFHRLLVERVANDGPTEKLRKLLKATDETLHLMRSTSINKKIALQNLVLKF